MYVTVVKSFTASHPFAGWAKAPVDVHRYVDGRAHVSLFGAAVGLKFQCWLAPPPLESQIWTGVPLAVRPPGVSRTRPLATLVRV